MRKILKYTDAVFTASRPNADCSANFKILIFFFKFLEKFNLLSKSFMFLFILFSLVSILKLYFSCLNPWLIDYWKDFNLVLEVYVKVQFSFQSFLFWHFYPFSFKCLRFNLTTSFLIRFLIHCKKVQFNPFF
jgi:hypothetical protein